jgi:hypothetical protein
MGLDVIGCHCQGLPGIARACPGLSWRQGGGAFLLRDGSTADWLGGRGMGYKGLYGVTHTVLCTRCVLAECTVVRTRSAGRGI